MSISIHLISVGKKLNINLKSTKGQGAKSPGVKTPEAKSPTKVPGKVSGFGGLRSTGGVKGPGSAKGKVAAAPAPVPAPAEPAPAPAPGR